MVPDKPSLFANFEIAKMGIDQLSTTKWMTKEQYLQGLGLAQSMPGPFFNFAAYLGAVYHGALIAYLGIFGPCVILIFAAVPFWARLRHVRWFKSTHKGGG